jgi:acyl phosphate:glycerol-3-phosphate acyltransferase
MINRFDLGFLILISYFVSAIPFGVVVSKLKGVDLSTIGSGNTGATNVYRALGIKYAVIVFLLDGIKGWGATYLAINIIEQSWAHVCIGFIAIIGHSLSCFVKFKGGKGAATGIGVIFALSPLIGLIVSILAALIIYVTRYVSLATILCSLGTPVLFYVLDYPLAYTIFLLVICFFIVYRHKSNISRLLKGKENKI